MDSSLENLDDVQLAILLSLVANEHCILTASREDIEKLQDEVETVRITIGYLGRIGAELTKGL